MEKRGEIIKEYMTGLLFSFLKRSWCRRTFRTHDPRPSTRLSISSFHPSCLKSQSCGIDHSFYRSLRCAFPGLKFLSCAPLPTLITSMIRGRTGMVFLGQEVLYHQKHCAQKGN